MPLSEDQIREIRNIEIKLERMEAVFVERNRKSDEMNDAIIRMETKIDALASSLPREYVTNIAFTEFKGNLTSLLTEQKDGVKTWQGWVTMLVPSLISAIIGLYVIFGG